MFANQAELETALDLLCTDEAAAIATYGAVATWVTSVITSMKGLLSPHYSNGGYSNNGRPHMATCNVAEIGDLHTSQVTDMSYVEGPPLPPPPLPVPPRIAYDNNDDTTSLTAD